ncbi:hypothetical protein L2E82_35977 [Cichorium intybus]|uniref:Uncharacterized protein n=1 Tax=Cichorium intybus TaxID=13427 RepID=A0ACB9BQE6_CICIN|nr:hypothetical protein L2E82_35977 [Cichorium intybus]
MNGSGDGDVINIDVTVYLNGYHDDISKTFLCGNVDDATKRLVKVTEECLERDMVVCKDGALFRKIGKRISEHAEKFGYGIVHRFVGHGNEKPGSMVEGQTFTIDYLSVKYLPGRVFHQQHLSNMMD